MYHQSIQRFIKSISFFFGVIGLYLIVLSFQPLWAQDDDDDDEHQQSEKSSLKSKSKGKSKGKKKGKKIKSGQFTEEFAAGITLGIPTGLNFLVNLEERGKLNNTLAYHFVGGWALVSSDWRAIYFKRFEGLVDPYIGIGAEIFVSQKDFLFAARIPIGIEYVFPMHPLIAFLEFVPAIGLIPQTVFIPQLSLGIQFRF
jgi:hypothetical protein